VGQTHTFIRRHGGWWLVENLTPGTAKTPELLVRKGVDARTIFLIEPAKEANL
jgi:hypothetical protein